MRIQTTHFDGKMTFEELVEALARSGRPLDFLFGAATIFPGSGLLNTDFTSPIHPNALAAIMAAAVIAGKGHDSPAPGCEVRIVTQPLLAALCDRAFAMNGSLGDEGQEEAVRKLRSFTSALAPQLALGGDPLSGLGRLAILAGHRESAAVGLPQDPMTADLLRRHLNLTSEELLTGLLVLWIGASKAAFIHLPTFLRKMPDPDNLVRIARQVLRWISISRDRAETLLRNELARLPGFARGVALFRRFPFLELGPDHYLCAPHHFARGLVTSGLFFSARDAAANLLETRARNRYDNDFSRSIGNRFQQYAHHVVGRALPDFQGFYDVALSADGARRAPDSVFVAPDRRAVVILQAKARLPTDDFFFGASHKGYEEAFAHYARLVSDSVKFLDFAAHWDPNALPPVAREVVRYVREAQQIVLLGATPALPALFHVPGFRDHLERHVHANLGGKDRAWSLFREWSDARRICHWHIDAVEAFEISAAGAKPNLLRTLRRWQRRARWAIGRGEFPPSLGEFAAGASDGPGRLGFVADLGSRLLDATYEVVGEHANGS